MLSSVIAEKRIKSFNDIGDIVSAMKAYAAVAVRKADEAVNNIRRCEEAVVSAMADIANHPAQLSPVRGNRGKRVLVGFGSSLGLCGIFNEKMARAIVAAYRDGDVLVVIGKRLQFFLGLIMGTGPAESFDAPSSLDGIGMALRESVSRIQPLYAEEGYYDLSVIFTAVTANTADIVIEQILPPDPDRMKAASPPAEAPLLYEDPEKVFAGSFQEFLHIHFWIAKRSTSFCLRHRHSI